MLHPIMETLRGQVGIHSRQELEVKQPLANGINAEESAKRGRANASVGFNGGDNIAANVRARHGVLMSHGWSVLVSQQ